MRQIRQQTPVVAGIALTGYGMEDDLRRTRDAGFDEHLVKPIDIFDLERSIDRVTGGRCDRGASFAGSGAPA
jgi:CheY-like chemotaxis protein